MFYVSSLLLTRKGLNSSGAFAYSCGRTLFAMKNNTLHPNHYQAPVKGATTDRHNMLPVTRKLA